MVLRLNPTSNPMFVIIIGGGIGTGTIAQRPNTSGFQIGDMYFNTTTNSPNWVGADGNWHDALGNVTSSGTISQRPSTAGLPVGTVYFNTTTNQPNWVGADANWHDAMGNIV